MKPTPSAAVLTWFAAQAPEGLFVSAVTQAEMVLGARMLPVGKRHTTLESALAAMFDEDFAGRILLFDAAAVPHDAEIVGHRRSFGRPIAHFDAQIATIARQSGARLATRSTADFERCGVALVDPWTGSIA